MSHPITTKQQALSLLEQHRPELQRFGVSQCGLFGSFSRDDADDQSDIDILVAFEPEKKTFDNFMDLAFFLEETFGRSIDLITIESLSPYIGPHILREVEYVSLSP